MRTTMDQWLHFWVKTFALTSIAKEFTPYNRSLCELITPCWSDWTWQEFQKAKTNDNTR